MEHSSPERAVRRGVLLSGGIPGYALGVVAVAGGSVVARGSGGTLTEAVVITTVAVLSVLVGIWAGAPAADRGELPMRERWIGAALAAAAAGAVATIWTLYAGAPMTAFGRVLSILALIALPAYTVGLIFPVMLAAADRRLEALDEDPGPWAPLGDLVGGALAGLAVGTALAGLVLLPWAGAPPLLLATAVLLLMPLVLPDVEEGGAEEVVLHETESALFSLRVTEVTYPGDRQPERRLYLDGEQESGELVRSGAPTLAYIAAAEAWLTSSTPRGAGYLFLGGGAYTLPRRIVERDPRASVTVVELDPEVTRLAYRFFGLRRDHGIVSVHGDARAYVGSTREPLYDRIYLDVYTGHEAVPFHLVTREAFAGVLRRLSSGGAMGMNLIGTTQGPESTRMWSVVRTVADVFPATALYSYHGLDFPDRQNLLLLGAPDPSFEFPSRAGLLDRLGPEEWPVPERANVLRDLATTSGVRGGAAASASRPGSA